MKSKKTPITLSSIAAILLLLVNSFFINNSNEDSQSSSGKAENQGKAIEQSYEYAEYDFRSQEQLDSHYEKHGVEMGFVSADDYLQAARAVIGNPDSLHKIESEDGDDIYYLEDTNEFVIVSTDGYIRTYFNPSDGMDYFNRQ